MLQADKRETTAIKPYDIAVIMPFAYVMSQSILTGSVFWFLISYAFFINYAVMRRENG